MSTNFIACCLLQDGYNQRPAPWQRSMLLVPNITQKGVNCFIQCVSIVYENKWNGLFFPFRTLSNSSQGFVVVDLRITIPGRTQLSYLLKYSSQRSRLYPPPWISHSFYQDSFSDRSSPPTNNARKLRQSSTIAWIYLNPPGFANLLKAYRHFMM